MNRANSLSGLLLALQAVSTVYLWTLNPLGRSSAEAFSLFIAINLLAFAMLSQIYRGENASRPPSRPWLLLASFILIALLLLNFLAT